MKRLKLRNWVKVLLVVLLVGSIVKYVSYVNDSYNQCMAKNNNTNICETLKN